MRPWNRLLTRPERIKNTASSARRTAPVKAAEQKAAEQKTEEQKTAEQKVAEQMAAEPKVIPGADSVFHYFYKICAIPHGSFHTKEISDYLVQFASERGLYCRKDEANNVIIKCPASPGCENAPTVILQGHMDMVLEKEADREINMETEAITVIEDGDWIRADGTTLGGDNGIAVAMMLALMDDPSIVHPALECIITSDEEVGMLGAQALDPSDLEGRLMLNLDSEEEGVVTAGCAGGAEIHQVLPMKRKRRNGIAVDLKISGLLGGHSGEAIRFGRANAILIMARLLRALSKETDIRIISFQGGGKDNAIPREASARILLPVPEDTPEKEYNLSVEEFVKAFHEEVQAEFVLQDPGMEITCSIAEQPEEADVFSRKATRRCLKYLMAVPDGVLVYSPSFKNLPRTSLNLGILKSTPEGIETVFLVRSSIESQKRRLVDKLECIAEGFGVKSTLTGSYPAWEYRIKSDFRDRIVRLYEKENGVRPKVSATHGGLECGLLSAKMPGLDAVSMGPNMKDIHTPSEQLSKSSTERLWQFLIALLRDMALEGGEAKEA